ncbi:tail completion and sheath stabilizer protein [Salmonella phage barely]|uniref:Tail completion and sheath stabilizer n=3 Tax=Kuttervirus TaxID=2169536 RepID=G9IIJ0_9CAUD|nr:tail completion and sheath stabilizer [Escherichia phage PhaxI]YP_009888564.1 tail completion and sheath stabilizer protein [Salmonella phage barely]AEW24328.1 tail completion and sheath stabilizer [Escherichia phage PhaxI]QIO03046.1 tail completion and sheath stabilizer protein [Salmonella phage barely]WDS51342.1 tail tube [Salmonella phage SeF6a]
MTGVQFKNENPNFAASDKWRLTIGDLVLLTRSIHDFSIPGVYSEGIEGPSPGDVLNSIPSERLTYDPIVFTFVIDESWYNWEQIYNWIASNAGSDLAVSRDITIDLLDNMNRPIGLQLLLEEARPTALDNVLVDVDAAVPQLVTTVTFKYLKLTPTRVTREIDKQ